MCNYLLLEITDIEKILGFFACVCVSVCCAFSIPHIFHDETCHKIDQNLINSIICKILSI